MLPRTLTDPGKGPLFAIATVLLLTGGAAAWYGVGELAPHDHAAEHAADGHHHAGGHAAAEAPRATCPAGARVPATGDLTRLDNIGAAVIRGDQGWTPAAGVRGGSGTIDDPYILSGIRASLLHLRDTTAYFVLAGSDVGTLILDWNGQGGLVCKNHIGDLRVNRNVERIEAPTAGIVDGNRIDKVGQIRHFDGVFRNNEVGTPTSRGVVLNIDGMNAALFTGNVIHGGVDMKLHGHHHGEPGESHMHTVPGAEEQGAEGSGEGLDEGEGGGEGYDDGVDHTFRKILFQFRGNTIHDRSGFGLRYNDLNHAGDDRTATSEETPELEKPHIHATRIHIEDNTISGAPLRVEIVNARDERHLPGQHALLVVRANTVKDLVAGSAILVSAVTDADVLIEDNTARRAQVAGLPLSLGTAAGVDLAGFANATVRVVGNTIEGYSYGVRARQFDERTEWTVGGNTVSGARHEVFWDESVPNGPGKP